MHDPFETLYEEFDSPITIDCLSSMVGTSRVILKEKFLESRTCPT